MSCIMYAYLEELGYIVRYFVNVLSMGMSGHVEIIENWRTRGKTKRIYILHVYKPLPSAPIEIRSLPPNFSIKKFRTIDTHTRTH